jgi:hypothetical protein
MKTVIDFLKILPDIAPFPKTKNTCPIILIETPNNEI